MSAIVIAYVSVCKLCGAIGGASADGNLIYTPAHQLCASSGPSSHYMAVVPVVVPVPA